MYLLENSTAINWKTNIIQFNKKLIYILIYIYLHNFTGIHASGLIIYCNSAVLYDPKSWDPTHQATLTKDIYIFSFSNINIY